MRKLPALVAKLTTIFDGWIVGSAADPAKDLSLVRDWDVFIPFSTWSEAAQLIPINARPNTFGGWKCESEGCQVDVWPDDLGKIMNSALNKYAWHPRSGIRITTIN